MFPSPFARLFGIKSAPFDNEQYRNQGNKATEKRNCYQKVIICPSEPRRLIFVYGDAIFALPGDVLLWLQRCDFRTVKKPFPLSTAAQNIHVFRRKSLSLGNHFFERLKTANFSTACGTSTLKSLPSRAFFVSDVHLRPRKHFSRCTLDCGFKTAESPALRGFEAGPRALATAALYLVLLSNGFPYSKIRLKKFDFSPIDTPANIAKKLPSQRCSQPFLIAFSTSRTNGPCSLLQAKAGTHSAFRERSHTRAHAPKQGAFRMGVVSLLSERSARSPTSPGRVSERQVLPLLGLGRGRS